MSRGGETQKRAYKIYLFTQTRTFIDLQSLSLSIERQIVVHLHHELINNAVAAARAVAASATAKELRGAGVAPTE